MYAKVNEYKDILKSNEQEYDVYLILQDGTKVDSDISGFRLIYTLGEKIIGNFVSRRVEFNLFNTSLYNITNKEFEVFVGLKDNNAFNYISLGKFIANKPETKDEKTDECSIIANDYSLKFKVPYEPIITFPCTVSNAIKQICEHLNIEYIANDFINANFLLEEFFIDEDANFFQVIKGLSEAGFANAHIVNSNSLIVKSPSKNKDYTFDLNEIFEFKKEDNKFGPLNAVVASRVVADDGSTTEDVYARNEESISKNGIYEYKVIQNDAIDYDRQTAVNNMLAGILDFEYVPATIETVYNPATEVGDLLEVPDAKTDTSFLLYAKEITADLASGLMTIESTEKTKTETDYTAATAKDKRQKTEYKVNKMEGKITQLISKTDAQSERITSITSDLNGVETRVSSTETKIENAESAIEETQADVQELDAKVADEVSNLQSQIDGTIQFWNGSEIPTLNNEPASLWTTEEDKNNHRADLYTVIEDVDGELKQGKSYRFDKVGNTWTWVELTDNELSAVQALAESKAKVFVTTPKVPYNAGDLWLRDKELYECQTAKDASGVYTESDWVKATKYTDDTAAALAQMTADQAIQNTTLTATTEEAKEFHIENSADSYCKSVEIYGESTQDGTPTPDVPVEIESVSESVEIKSLGKNKFNINATPTKNGDNAKYEVNNNSLRVYGNWYVGYLVDVKPNADYYLSYNRILTTIAQSTGRVVIWTTDIKTIVHEFNNVNGGSFNTGNNTQVYILFYCSSTTSWGDVTFENIQLEEGTQATEFEEYKESITAIPLLHDMRSLSYVVRDRIYWEDGKWYDEQKNNERIFDGTENWVIYSNRLHTFGLSAGEITGINARSKCNYYSNISSEDFDVKDGLYSIYTSAFMICDMECSTVEEFKAKVANWYASGKPLEIVYEMYKPIMTEITEKDHSAMIEALEHIRTFAGLTNITSDAPAKLTYYTNTVLNDEYETKLNAEKQYKITTKKFADQKITNDSIISTVVEVQETIRDNYVSKETLSTELIQTKESYTFKINQEIEDLKDGGVPKVVSELVTIDKDGLKVGRSDSEFSNLMNNVGNYQYNAGKLLAKYDKDGAEIPRLKSDIGVIAGVKHVKENVGGIIHHKTYVIE